MNIKLASLWTHLEGMSLLRQYERTLIIKQDLIFFIRTLQVPDLEALVKTLQEEVKKERKEKEEVIAAKDRLKQEKDTVRKALVVYKGMYVVDE